MAGQEELKEAFNFWELISMMDDEHKQEVEELKQCLEEKELEITELTNELENKVASKKEAEERADFWYRMNETTSRLAKMQLAVEKNSKVKTEKDSFLEKGQKKPGRKKRKIPSQKKQMKIQNSQMNLMPMIAISRQLNQGTNMMTMSIMPRQMNMMTNLKTQNMNRMTVKPMTMTPMFMPARTSSGLVSVRR